MSDPGPDARLDPPAEPGAGEGRFRRLHPLSPLLRGGIVALAIGYAAIRQLLGTNGAPFGWPIEVVVGAVVLVVAWGLVGWWTTRYRLGEQALRVESGLLARRSRQIRLDRVQAVEVHQPLLGRLVGLAAVRVETAGGGTEAELAYLTLGQAHAFRAELLGRVAVAAAGAGPGSVDAPRSADEPVRPDELLHTVPAGLLLVSQLVRTGPLLALSSGLLAAAIAVLLGKPVGLVALGPVLVGVAGAVWTGFAGHYGFALTRTSRGLAVRAGLLDVRTQSVPPDRVQGVLVLEPVVWRWLGWCEVQVTVAGVRARGDDEARLAHTLVPVAPRDLGVRVAGEALAGRDPAAVPLKPSPRRARLLDPVGGGVLAAGRDHDLVVTRRGRLTRRTDAVPRHKVQSCAVRQGPLQRWLGLATAHVHLPSGPVVAEARHRDAEPTWGTVLGLATPQLTGVTHGTVASGVDPTAPVVP